MSKSLRRVQVAAERAGLEVVIQEMTTSTRSAAEAAAVVACALDQIAKSVIFKGAKSSNALLFLTAGGNRVSEDLAAIYAGEPLLKADAAFIRAATGFAIGGVSPIGSTQPVRGWFDPRLLEFDTIWAAAGTPRHLFEVAPQALLHVMTAEVAAFTAAP